MTPQNNPGPWDNVHPDLLIAKQYFDACGFGYTQPIAGAESAEYGAYTFTLYGKSVLYRVAKITPTKTGQFVTVWKRNDQGITVPYHMSDNIDLFIISTRSADNIGLFIFPKEVLLQQGIISGHLIEGKRGIRVYPPWDVAASKQAQKTQQWQTAFFLEIHLKAGQL